jgi:S1-C subfamily serine protease
MSSSPSTASALSSALADAVESASASTVRVAARRRLAATGIAWGNGKLVVTADHVIEREDELQVGLPDGRAVAATIAGRDPGTDLAVLRIETALPGLAEAPAARVGQLAMAVGRPGSEPEASVGVVSAVGGPWRSQSGIAVSGYIRSDATFFPGFSGGPLIDADGRMLGINSSRLGRGAGITLPASDVARLVEQLLRHGGRLPRAFVGISTRQVAVSGPPAAELGGREKGLLVMSVEPGSAAADAGLLVGDILVDIAGRAIEDAPDLRAALGAEAIGAELEFRVVRGGVLTAVTVVPTSRS